VAEIFSVSFVTWVRYEELSLSLTPDNRPPTFVEVLDAAYLGLPQSITLFVNYFILVSGLTDSEIIPTGVLTFNFFA